MKEQGISLSFLDMLTCALGGMILLFLIFSTFQHQGQEGPGRKPPQEELSPNNIAATSGKGVADPKETPQLWKVTSLGGDFTISGANKVIASVIVDANAQPTWLFFIEKPGEVLEKETIRLEAKKQVTLRLQKMHPIDILSGPKPKAMEESGTHFTLSLDKNVQLQLRRVGQ